MYTTNILICLFIIGLFFRFRVCFVSVTPEGKQKGMNFGGSKNVDDAQLKIFIITYVYILVNQRSICRFPPLKKEINA